MVTLAGGVRLRYASRRLEFVTLVSQRGRGIPSTLSGRATVLKRRIEAVPSSDWICMATSAPSRT
jgi:hypothetical protein